MLTQVHPKIPMRNKKITREFYINSLGFEEIGTVDFEGYLIIKRDQIELHFFCLKPSVRWKTMAKSTFGQIILKHYTKISSENKSKFIQTVSCNENLGDNRSFPSSIRMEIC